MADKRDYYEVLGVDRNATDEEIKGVSQGCEDLSSDLNPGDKAAEQKFKEVNEAYSVLSDKEKNSGTTSSATQAWTPSARGRPRRRRYRPGQRRLRRYSGIYSAVCSAAAGRAGRTQRAGKGRDITISLSIEFLESVFGCSTISLPQRRGLRRLQGHRRAGRGRQTCPACGAPARIAHAAADSGARSERVHLQPVRRHRGGRLSRTPTRSAAAKGYTNGERTIEASIPAGLRQDNRLSFRPGLCGPAGRRNRRLFTFLRSSRVLFQRQGNDISSHVPITMVQAASAAYAGTADD